MISFIQAAGEIGSFFLVKVVFARLLKLKYTAKVKMSCGGDECDIISKITYKHNIKYKG